MSSREHEQSAWELREFARDLAAARGVARNLAARMGAEEHEAQAKVDQAMAHFDSAVLLLRAAAELVEQVIPR